MADDATTPNGSAPEPNEIEPNEIQEVGPSLFRVPLITPTLPPATRTNTYVMAYPSGTWVLDPGSPDPNELATLLDFVDTLPGGRAGIAGYIVTHRHGDHWGGLGWLMQRAPAPIVARDHSALPVEGHHPKRHGIDWLESAAPELDVVLTPGHCDDHIAVLTPERDLLAGDVVAGIGTVVIAPPDGHMRSYFETLEWLIDATPRRIFPAHGPTCLDGVAKLREYLAHRTHRENQVIAALREHEPADPADLVPDIYPDLPFTYYPLAGYSVLAHLIKLEEEGRAARGRKGWALEV